MTLMKYFRSFSSSEKKHVKVPKTIVMRCFNGEKFCSKKSTLVWVFSFDFIQLKSFFFSYPKYIISYRHFVDVCHYSFRMKNKIF